MAKRTTLGKKSQSVVPSDIQEHLGISQGDQLEWVPGPGHSVIVRGFRSVPATMITAELEKRLDERERAMEQGRSFRVKSTKALTAMAHARKKDQP